MLKNNTHPLFSSLLRLQCSKSATIIQVSSFTRAFSGRARRRNLRSSETHGGHGKDYVDNIDHGQYTNMTQSIPTNRTATSFYRSGSLFNRDLEEEEDFDADVVRNSVAYKNARSSRQNRSNMADEPIDVIDSGRKSSSGLKWGAYFDIDENKRLLNPTEQDELSTQQGKFEPQITRSTSPFHQPDLFSEGEILSDDEKEVEEELRSIATSIESEYAAFIDGEDEIVLDTSMWIESDEEDALAIRRNIDVYLENLPHNPDSPLTRETEARIALLAEGDPTIITLLREATIGRRKRQLEHNMVQNKNRQVALETILKRENARYLDQFRSLNLDPPSLLALEATDSLDSSSLWTSSKQLATTSAQNLSGMLTSILQCNSSNAVAQTTLSLKAPSLASHVPLPSDPALLTFQYALFRTSALFLDYSLHHPDFRGMHFGPGDGGLALHLCETLNVPMERVYESLAHARKLALSESKENILLASSNNQSDDILNSNGISSLEKPEQSIAFPDSAHSKARKIKSRAYGSSINSETDKYGSPPSDLDVLQNGGKNIPEPIQKKHKILAEARMTSELEYFQRLLFKTLVLSHSAQLPCSASNDAISEEVDVLPVAASSGSLKAIKPQGTGLTGLGVQEIPGMEEYEKPLESDLVKTEDPYDEVVLEPATKQSDWLPSKTGPLGLPIASSAMYAQLDDGETRLVRRAPSLLRAPVPISHEQAQELAMELGYPARSQDGMALVPSPEKIQAVKAARKLLRHPSVVRLRQLQAQRHEFQSDIMETKNTDDMVSLLLKQVENEDEMLGEGSDALNPGNSTTRTSLVPTGYKDWAQVALEAASNPQRLRKAAAALRREQQAVMDATIKAPKPQEGTLPTLRQHRIATNINNALSAFLSVRAHTTYSTQFRGLYPGGVPLEIMEVSVTPDLRTAYVRWTLPILAGVFENSEKWKSLMTQSNPLVLPAAVGSPSAQVLLAQALAPKIAREEQRNKAKRKPKRSDKFSLGRDFEGKLSSSIALLPPAMQTQVQQAEADLHRCAGDLRRTLASMLGLRFTPKLEFHLWEGERKEALAPTEFKPYLPYDAKRKSAKSQLRNERPANTQFSFDEERAGKNKHTLH